jgi:hypothetical protein
MKLALLVLVVALTGCQRLTDVLVRIDSADLTSTDISTVKIVVTDLELPVDAPAEYAPSELLLCAPGQTSDCSAFPITVTLAPGSRSPTDKVRVEVDTFAADGSAFSSDASIFSFTPHHEQHVDFFLSNNCHGTDCASADLACGTTGTCSTLSATKNDPRVDLATSVTPTGAVSRVSFATGTRTTTSGQPYQVTPPDTRSGDLVVVGLANPQADQAQPVPAGWQLLAQVGTHSAVLFHFAAGQEIGDTNLYTFSTANSGNLDGSWAVTVFRGVAAPIHAVTDTIIMSVNGSFTLHMDDGSAVTAGGELVGVVLNEENDFATCTTPNAHTLLHTADGSALVEVTGGGGAVDLVCTNGAQSDQTDFYQFVLDPAAP